MKKTKKTYSQEFFKYHEGGAVSSAKEAAPLILKLLKPKSIVDVGCGTGVWLAAFHRLGLKNFLGVDGGWVEKKMLRIPKKNFLAADLKKSLPVRRQFDLVVSLEVAEHLPKKNAKTFVASLVKLGPAVLFSAATPRQGGIEHFNEQWPEYWARLFRRHKFLAVDCLRKKLDTNKKIEPWYTQNILLFAKKEYIEKNKKLKKYFKKTDQNNLEMRHPKIYPPKIKNPE